DFCYDLPGLCWTNAVNVLEPDQDPLVGWNVNTSYTGHGRHSCCRLFASRSISYSVARYSMPLHRIPRSRGNAARGSWRTEHRFRPRIRPYATHPSNQGLGVVEEIR